MRVDEIPETVAAGRRCVGPEWLCAGPLLLSIRHAALRRLRPRQRGAAGGAATGPGDPARQRHAGAAPGRGGADRRDRRAGRGGRRRPLSGAAATRRHGLRARLARCRASEPAVAARPARRTLFPARAGRCRNRRDPGRAHRRRCARRDPGRRDRRRRRADRSLCRHRGRRGGAGLRRHRRGAGRRRAGRGVGRARGRAPACAGQRRCAPRPAADRTAGARAGRAAGDRAVRRRRLARYRQGHGRGPAASGHRRGGLGQPALLLAQQAAGAGQRRPAPGHRPLPAALAPANDPAAWLFLRCHRDAVHVQPAAAGAARAGGTVGAVRPRPQGRFPDPRAQLAGPGRCRRRQAGAAGDRAHPPVAAAVRVRRPGKGHAVPGIARQRRADRGVARRPPFRPASGQAGDDRRRQLAEGAGSPIAAIDVEYVRAASLQPSFLQTPPGALR